LARQFQRRFLDIDQSETIIACGGLTDRDEMSNLHRGYSIDASCHVSVNFAKWFQRRFLKYWPIKNKNCLWRAMFGNGS
jgi:hypothetical protein